MFDYMIAREHASDAGSTPWIAGNKLLVQRFHFKSRPRRRYSLILDPVAKLCDYSEVIRIGSCLPRWPHEGQCRDAIQLICRLQSQGNTNTQAGTHRNATHAEAIQTHSIYERMNDIEVRIKTCRADSLDSALTVTRAIDCVQAITRLGQWQQCLQSLPAVGSKAVLKDQRKAFTSSSITQLFTAVCKAVKVPGVR